MAALIAVETAVILLLAVLVIGLLRSHADILRALHELGVGVGDPSDTGSTPPTSLGLPQPAPGGHAGAPPTGRSGGHVSGLTPEGDATTLAVDGGGTDTMLAFLSSGCLTCREIWDGLRAAGRQPLPGARTVVVTHGPEADSPSKIAELAAGLAVPVVLSSEAWNDYEVPVAPYFVYVDGETGRVAGEGAASRWDQVTTFVEQARADAATIRTSSDLVAHRAARRRLDALRADREREQRADEELLAAGIAPGDARLHPQAHGHGAAGSAPTPPGQAPDGEGGLGEGDAGEARAGEARR